MGDWTGTVPAILGGDIPTGDQWKSITDELAAVSGVWTTWSPTLTNLTAGNGTLTARYRRVGKTVDFRIAFTLGSSSAVGTEPSFTLPATPSTDYVNATGVQIPAGNAYYRDNGTASRPGVAVVFTGSTASFRYANHTTGDSLAQITATVPWTWTTGDLLSAWGTYETT